MATLTVKLVRPAMNSCAFRADSTRMKLPPSAGGAVFPDIFLDTTGTSGNSLGQSLQDYRFGCLVRDRDRD